MSPAVATGADANTDVGGRVRRNVVRLTIGYSSNRITRFIAAVVMARILSVSDFGVVTAIVAGAGLAAQMASFGITDIGSRDIAADPDRADRLVGLVQSIRLGLLVVSIPAVLVLGSALDWSWGTLAFGVIMTLALGGAVDWALRGLEEMEVVARIAAVGGFAMLACMLLMLWVGATVESATAAFALGEIATTALTWKALRSRGVRPRFSLDGARPFVRGSWTVAAAGLVAYIYFSNADALLLIAFSGAEETGLYSAAYRVFLAAATVSLLAAWSLMPALVKQTAAESEERVAATRSQTMWLLLAYGACVLGLAEMFGREALDVIFGAEFASMDTVLITLCIGLVWYTVGYPLGYGSIADNEPRRLLPGAIAAGVSNLILALVLIPPLGAIGAATATAVAFAAGGLAWLMQARIPWEQRISCLSAVALISAAGVVAASLSATRLPIGILSTAFGLVLLSIHSSWTPARVFGRRVG